MLLKTAVLPVLYSTRARVPKLRTTMQTATHNATPRAIGTTTVIDVESASRALNDQLGPTISRATLSRSMALLPLGALLLSWSMPVGGYGAAGLCLMLGLLIAAVTDIRYRKIYNWTTYPLIVWSILLAAAVTMLGLCGYEAAWVGGVDLTGAMAGMLCCGAITLVAYFGSGGGAGDVKLALVVGGMLGVEQGLHTVAFAYILAAGGALLLSIADASALRLLSGLARKLGSKLSPLVPPPSTKQERLLQRKTPLAGYFVLAAWLVMQ